jgi:transposase
MIRFTLQTERLGPLPIINHFMQRIGLEDALNRHVPSDLRCAVTHARALGVLLRSIIIEREPIYRQQETVHEFGNGMFGINAEEMGHLSDDRIGRALDRLFDADRAALLTDVVVAVGQHFGVKYDEFHNDSTSISFCGSYRVASGRKIRGRTAPAITYGHSKDHRPDLKQLLLILTMTADGNVPVAFRCTDGNASDARTHIETWNTLRTVAGRADFLYVADSKLCSREDMDYIDRAGGGVYPLITNDRNLPPAEVLEAHKGQPMIEKRFEQIKTVHEIASVFLKNEGRIEALFIVYFLALLVQALIERELRFAMKREKIEQLPIYPEQRQCAHPTTEQILRLFSLAMRNKLTQGGKTLQLFPVEFTDLQRQVLTLLGVSKNSYLPQKN